MQAFSPSRSASPRRAIRSADKSWLCIRRDRYVHTYTPTSTWMAGRLGRQGGRRGEQHATLAPCCRDAYSMRQSSALLYYCTYVHTVRRLSAFVLARVLCRVPTCVAILFRLCRRRTVSRRQVTTPTNEKISQPLRLGELTKPYAIVAPLSWQTRTPPG